MKAPTRSLAAWSLALVLALTPAADALAAADDVAPTLLGIPDDAELPGLAAASIEDDAPALEGDIDMASLQSDALERLASLAAEGWDPLALTDSLDYDPDAAFAFVRDGIAFDPYRGLLRGPAGTLAARAGNSLDRAVLLQAILGLMQVPTRLVFGELSEAQAEELLARAFEPPVAPMAPTPASVEAPLDWQAIAARAGRDYARLRSALGDQLAAIGSADREAAVEDVRSHTWVQAFIGTDWIDLDPTLSGSEPGQTMTTPRTVADEVPPAEIAEVTVSLVAETLDGETYDSATVLDERLPAWQAADQVILLTFQPEVAGIGGGILEALGSAGAFVPHLSVAGTDRAGSPFPVRGATDIFSGEGVAGPELARLRFEVGVTVPGRDPVISRRLLVDRLPRGVDPSSGTPAGLVLLPMAADAAGPVDLQSIRHIMVSVGASNPWLAAQDRVDVISFANELLLDPDAASSFDFDALFWPIAVTDQALVLGSERTSIAGIDAADDVRAFVSEPRVFIVTISGEPDAPAVSTDLAHDPVRILAVPGAATGATAQAELWYGALQAASETEFLRSVMRGFGGGTVESVSTASRSELTAFDEADAGQLDAAPASLRAALADGLLAVVPGDPASAAGWWTVDSRDGTTRSVSASGAGYGESASIGRGGRPISTPSGDPNRFKYRPTGRTPAPTCNAANEYTTPIGCVSLPAAVAFWGLYAVVGLTVAWGVNCLWQDAIGYQP